MQFNALRSAQNNFNLIRLLLASLVVLSHSYEIKVGSRLTEPLTRWFGTLSFGDVAVECFFLLSGYLILKSWQSRPEALPYLWRRLLRIWPAYLVCYGLCGMVLAPNGALRDGADFAWAPFVAGALTFGQPVMPPAFAGTFFPGINVPMWSIQYEFACYLLVAALGMLGVRGSKVAWLGAVLLWGGLFAVGQSGVLQPDGLAAHWLGKSFIRMPLFFLVGGLYAIYAARFQPTFLKVCGAALMLLASLQHASTAHLGLAIFGSYVLFSMATLKSPFLSRASRLPDVSYGLYLYAWPFSKLAYHWWPDQSPLVNFFSALGAACAAGWLSWTFIEKPALRLKNLY